MKYQYNDNELLYLMYECEDQALNILFQKYFNLIHKRLHLFKIKSKNYDDFFQEGLMALNDAINTYDRCYNKTFNKYFDLILQRRIIYMLRKEKNYFYSVSLVENLDGYLEENDFKYRVEDYPLTILEKTVFALRFQQNYGTADIAKILDCNVKKVYNIIFSIKQKMLATLSANEK